MRTRLILLLSTLLLLSIACATLTGNNATAPTPPPQSAAASTTPETAAPAETTSSGASTTPTDTTKEPDTTSRSGITSELLAGAACDNAFMPVNREVTWRYYSSYTGEAPTQFTIVITDVRTDGFTSSLAFPELFSTIQWNCGPDGLFSSEFAQFTIAMMPGTNIETLSYEGTTLPAEEFWKIGYTWTSSYQINMSIEESGLSTTATVTFSNQITAIEEVTVPAGTYPESYRMESSGTISLNIMGSVIDTPIQTTNWYAKNIGMVKSVSTDEAGTSTVELLAIE